MTESSQISQETIRRSRLFWEQSRQDLQEAKGYLRREAFLESGHLGFQAAINALSAVCMLQGHYRLPNTTPLLLLDLCREADRRFADLDDPCQALEEAAGGSPFAEHPPTGDAKAKAVDHLRESERILAAVRGYLKENKKRFYSP